MNEYPCISVPPDEKVKPLKFKWGQAELERSWERKQKTKGSGRDGREVVSKSKQNDLTRFRKTLVALK